LTQNREPQPASDEHVMSKQPCVRMCTGAFVAMRDGSHV
jgi:hypothetical protein